MIPSARPKTSATIWIFLDKEQTVIDLKPYFDAAQVADAEVMRIMDDMNTHFSDGTDEGKQAALDLRPALDEAKVKAADANKLYLSMRDAAATSNSAAREFVPATDHLNETGDPATEMMRQEFDALNAAAKVKFIRAGGAVIESD